MKCQSLLKHLGCYRSGGDDESLCWTSEYKCTSAYVGDRTAPTGTALEHLRPVADAFRTRPPPNADFWAAELFLHDGARRSSLVAIFGAADGFALTRHVCIREV